MSELDGTTKNEVSTGINRRRLLRTVGVTAAAFVGVSGTASAHQSKFFGCERVCTGTQGSYAVVAVDDTYRCREMQQASGSADVPWDWTTYCYEAAGDEVVVGLLEENVIQGGTENPDGTCTLCLNGNDCATAAFDSPSDVVTALNESDTCGICAGNVEVSDSCTTTTAPGDGSTDTGGSGDDGTDNEDGTGGDDTDDGSEGGDGSSDDESSGDDGTDGNGGEDSTGSDDSSGDGGSDDGSSGDGGGEDDSSSGDDSSDGGTDSSDGGTDGSDAGGDGSGNESGDGDDGTEGENGDSDDSSDSGGGGSGDDNEDGSSIDNDDGDQSETNPSDDQGSDDGSRSVDSNDESDTGRSRNDWTNDDFDIDADYRESRDPAKEYPDVDLEELAERRAEQESDDGAAWECDQPSENRTAMERWYDRDDTPADPRDRDRCESDADDTDGTMTAMERWFARLDTPDVTTLFDSKR